MNKQRPETISSFESDIARVTFDALFPTTVENPSPDETARPTNNPKSLIVRDCKCPKCGRRGLTVWGDGTHECHFKTCKYLQIWSSEKPPLQIIRQIDPDYDTEIYRTEIDKALSRVKENLREADFKDLRQIVDFEIWKATKCYGDKMNAPLAYTVADNQAQTFLRKIIEHPGGMTGFPKDETTGNALLAISLPFQGNDAPLNDDDKYVASKAEIAVSKLPIPEENERDFQKEFENHRPELQRLVRSWFGTKRRVGEAVLEDPGRTVRDIPGVPKSTAAEVRKAVLNAFKSLILRDL